MNQIQILTSQNVTIHYQLASLQKRVKALLIDWLIKIGYILFLIVAEDIFDWNMSELTVFFLVIIPLFFYSLLFEVFMNGQTIGKSIMKIQVSKLDGTPPSLGDYLLRWIACLVEFLLIPSLSLIFYFFNNKGQRLGDLIANTTVVNKEKDFSLDDTLLHVADLPKNYEVSFPQVAQLSHKDVETIKLALNKYMDTSNSSILDALVARLHTVLAIDPSQKITPADIDKMVQDFNYFQLKESLA